MDFSWPNSMHLCLYTLLIILSSLLLPSVSVTTHVSCLPDQSSSLLQLKSGFFQSDLTSWQPGTDCCHGWEGVSCDKATGHVTALDISNRNITGNLSATIFNLTSLQHLNLANNDFSQNQIPTNGFEKLTMLTHLNLSFTYLFGQIQLAIANLTNLISLDLSNFSGELNLRMLVSQLSNLRELYLDYVDISENGTEWCRALAESVPHLQVLSMVLCHLSGPIESSLSQLGSLTVIRLSANNLKTQILDYFAEFPLKELLLDDCDLEGLFPHEIFQIPTLTKLDLSGNQELSGTLPNFPIVNSLESLVLDYTNFFGSTPDSIGNLINLSELSLSNCNFSGQIPAFIEKLGKLPKLDLSNNLFSGSIPPSLFSLPNLEALHLSNNKLSGQFRLNESSLLFSPLVELDLSNNSFSGSIPPSLFSLPNLEALHLSNNKLKLSGQFRLNESSLLYSPLVELDLSENQLDGPIPNSIVWLPSLSTLKLSSNNFNGTFDINLLGHLSNLTYLSLSDNQLSLEEVSDEQLSLAFPQITDLYLASCNLSQIPRLVRYAGNLGNVDLSKNRLHGVIPRWIWKAIINSSFEHNLNLLHNMFTSVEDVSPCGQCFSFGIVDFSFNKLKGVVPLVVAAFLDYSNNEFSEISLNYLENTEFLILSRNKLTGEIPSSICESNLTMLDLSYNNLSGSIPSCTIGRPSMLFLSLGGNKLSGEIPSSICESNLVFLDLSYNNLSGSIPSCTIGRPSMQSLSLRGNKLSGEIPSSICESNLTILDLSYNNLSGSIPSCTIGRPSMLFLSLRGNKLSGRLPRHINRSCELVILDLNNNNLEGNLPRSLTKCKDLALLDIGNNHIGGTFPFSLGKLPNLQVIILRSNRFYGTLGFPSNFGKKNSPFRLLRMIDLASNKFNGSLPPLWFNNFKSIQNLSSDAILGGDIVDLSSVEIFIDGDITVGLSSFEIDWISVTITYKGAQMTLEHNLPNLMISIDLSSNRFTGDIPEIIGELKGIKALNLSHNGFTGSIPNRLGRLTKIESLDLSWNQLSGEIPQELISLTSLSYLNLSSNHLVGRIPQYNQFLTFQNSSFEGNPGLCGVPLSKLCNVQIPGNNSTSPSTNPAKKMTAIVLLCLFIGLGFGTGFAIAIVIPIIKRARNAPATR